MGITPHIARLRAVVGHELLLLPVDEAGRLLLVQETGHDDGWHILGGAVDVLGGPDHEVRYPNGDRVAYVSAVYEAQIVEGSPAPSDGEPSEVAWFQPAELPALRLSSFARALLGATGHLRRLGAAAPQLSLRRRGHCVASNPLADGGTAWRSAAAQRHNTSLRIPKQVVTTGTSPPAA